MGYLTPSERAEAAAHERARAREEAARAQGARRQLAEKIVMIAIDQVVAHIIRPGPVAEERECYDMAKELRDFGPELVETVIDQINVNKGCL